MKRSAASLRSRPAKILVGYPYFPEASQQAKFHNYLTQHLSQDGLFQGSRPVRWSALYDSNPGMLYSKETDLGLLPVFNFNATSYYAQLGLLQPLETYFPAYSLDFIEAGWRKGLVGEHLYSLPLHVSIRVLYYRRDLLEKYSFNPPQTWDDLEEQATAILHREKDKSLQGFDFIFNSDVRFSVFLDQIWSQGTDLYENLSGWKLNRDALETALLRMQRFFQKGLIPTSVMTADFQKPFKNFLAGHSLFMHHWSDAIRLIHELTPQEQKRFGWCALPSLNAHVPGMAMMGGPSYVIPRATRYPKAAAKLLQRLLSPEIQSWYAQHLGWPFPGLKQVYYDPKVSKAKPYFSEAENLLKRGRLLEECVYLQKYHMDWHAIGGQELGSFLEGRSTTQEAVQRMEKRFAPLLPQPMNSGLTGRAVDYVQANPEKQLSVASVARQLQVSPEHLSRVFKAQTGQSPLHFIHASKMEQAKVLLKQSHLSVTEIAYLLGYKTPQHFSRLFRQHVRYSPREFR